MKSVKCSLNIVHVLRAIYFTNHCHEFLVFNICGASIWDTVTLLLNHRASSSPFRAEWKHEKFAESHTSPRGPVDVKMTAFPATKVNAVTRDDYLANKKRKKKRKNWTKNYSTMSRANATPSEMHCTQFRILFCTALRD